MNISDHKQGRVYWAKISVELVGRATDPPPALLSKQCICFAPTRQGVRTLRRFAETLGPKSKAKYKHRSFIQNLSYFRFKKLLCGHRAKGVVAQELFKMGLLDCFITEVAQQ
jgi:hypothetical protein